MKRRRLMESFHFFPGNDRQGAIRMSTQQQLNPLVDSNGDGDLLAGSTLEEYFAAHKVSGHVSQHLLNISAENDVMAAHDSKGGIRAHQVKEQMEQKNGRDDYEDDYESDTSTSKAEPLSKVAGMTLSDYLCVKENDDADALEKEPWATELVVSNKTLASTSDVSGMSLDHYFGAAIGEHKSDENGLAARADTKSPPKVKRKFKRSGHVYPQVIAKQQPFAVKGSGLIQRNFSSQNKSSDEENGSASPVSSLTPFQRHQKRKDRARVKQQRHAANGSSVSKAILVAEAASMPSAMLSVRDREKRKMPLGVPSGHIHHSSHYGSHSSTSNSQPPLPKLAASPSVRGLSHKAHDTDDNGDDASKKLPPL